MAEFKFRFTVKAEVDVIVTAPEEDIAYDMAVELVTEHLNTLSNPSATGVSVHTDIDGVGGDLVEGGAR